MKATPRAVLYTRVSTDEQAENGTSLAAQFAACSLKAEQIGARVVGHYEDAGISGAYYATRSGLQEALSAIEGKTGRNTHHCCQSFPIRPRPERNRPSRSV